MGFLDLAAALGASPVVVGAEGNTNLDREVIESVITETKAAAGSLHHASFKRAKGALDLAAFADFPGARIVVDTHNLAFDSALEVLEKTDLSLLEFAAQLGKVLATAEEAEANVGLAFTPVVVTNSPFVLNDTPVPQGADDDQGAG